MKSTKYKIIDIDIYNRCELRKSQSLQLKSSKNQHQILNRKEFQMDFVFWFIHLFSMLNKIKFYLSNKIVKVFLTRIGQIFAQNKCW